MSEDFFTTIQAARMIGVSEGTLRNWRNEGVGPVSYKPNAQKTARVYYLESEIKKWMDAGRSGYHVNIGVVHGKG